jgi:hypothetical protein
MSQPLPLQEVRLLRRIPMEQYGHLELEVTILDMSEGRALERATDVLERAAETLGVRERVAVTRGPKKDYYAAWTRRAGA